MAYLWLADHSQNLLLLQQLPYTLKPTGFSLHTLRTNSAFDLCQSEQMARKCQRALCKISHTWIIILVETVGFKPCTFTYLWWLYRTRKAQFWELTWKSCLHFISIEFYFILFYLNFILCELLLRLTVNNQIQYLLYLFCSSNGNSWMNSFKSFGSPSLNLLTLPGVINTYLIM